jgi:hypothetical protein
MPKFLKILSLVFLPFCWPIIATFVFLIIPIPAITALSSEKALSP